MYVTICGRFCPDEGAVAGYGNWIRAKYTAKWGVQIAGMIFQTRSGTPKLLDLCNRIHRQVSGIFISKTMYQIQKKACRNICRVELIGYIWSINECLIFYIKSSEMDHHLRALILHSFIQKSTVLSSSSIQTVLSAPESHRIMPLGSRALPPVGNCTLPWRYFFLS